MAGRPRKDGGTITKPAKEKKVQPKISDVKVELKDSNIGIPVQNSIADEYINSLKRDNTETQLDGLLNGNVFTELKTGKLSPEEEQQLLDSFSYGNNGKVNPMADDAEIIVDLPVSSDVTVTEITPAFHNMDVIIAKYNEKCNHPSDINQLLPYLRAVSECCDHITEFGVRNPTSTWAFLAGNPKQLVSYDIERSPCVDEAEAVAPNFKFVLGSTLDVVIDETDFLFIDTYHTAAQLSSELAFHADKVRKYIGFHDTTTFATRDEAPYELQPQQVYGNGAGLMAAITPFLAKGEFRIDFQTHINNGLMILRRIK